MRYEVDQHVRSQRSGFRDLRHVECLNVERHVREADRSARLDYFQAR